MPSNASFSRIKRCTNSMRQDRLLRLIAFTGILILGIFILGACQTAETPTPTEAPPTEIPPTEIPPTATPTEPPPTDVPPTATPLPDQSEFITAWESSQHNVYDLGHGPNTWCSRCHSPQNWDPEAFRGPPPSCFTCKFANEEEMRVAEGNPFVPEEEWVGIGCETCHEMSDGIASSEIGWLNPISMEYQDVNTPNELCEKCHVTTNGNSFGSAVTHEIYLGGSAHLNYGGFLGDVAPPTYCTDCHDPHSLEPMGCQDCHTDVLASDTHMKGFNQQHTNVSCMACHDSLGLDVGPHPSEEMEGLWVTQETTVGRGGPVTEFVLSHSPQWEVACDRCHFEENSWELTVFTADGEIPEPEEESDSGG